MESILPKKEVETAFPPTLKKQKGTNGMKEKKLTDEEIVRALECCIQNETENTCAYCIGCPASDWDSEDDLECNADMMKKSIDLIHRQKAEIERLTEEKNDWESSCHMWSEANKKNHLKFTKTLEKLCEEREKNAELQKQVDELEEERENMQAEIIASEEARLQAVKDTAKEIFIRLAKRKHQGFDLGGFFVEYHLRLEDLNWFEVKYGVEVE